MYEGEAAGASDIGVAHSKVAQDAANKQASAMRFNQALGLTLAIGGAGLGAWMAMPAAGAAASGAAASGAATGIPAWLQGAGIGMGIGSGIHNMTNTGVPNYGVPSTRMPAWG